MIGLVAGLGSGVIRDLLLQQGPPAALVNPVYIPAALAGTGLAFILDISGRGWDRVLIVLDAVALSLWAAAGAQKTLAAGLGWLPAVLLGTLTAVGGGAARDLMLQRVPAVFGGNALYASVAIVVASIQVLCTGLGEPVTGTILGLLSGVLFRLAAYRQGGDCRRAWTGSHSTSSQRPPGKATMAWSREARRQRRSGVSRGSAPCGRTRPARRPSRDSGPGQTWAANSAGSGLLLR